jgi:hypothetical protein
MTGYSKPTIQTLLAALTIVAVSHDSFGCATMVTFPGDTQIFCRNATCTFDPETCAGLNYTLESDSLVTKTGISGLIELEADCVAECSNCLTIGANILNQDQNDPCDPSTGSVFCPETEECVRPWEENSCPFNGTEFVGPVDLVCDNEGGSRCTNMSDACTFSAGTWNFGGFYLPNLLGTYSLPENCTATCQGCCVDCSTETNDDTPADTSPTSDPAPTSDSGAGTVSVALVGGFAFTTILAAFVGYV